MKSDLVAAISARLDRVNDSGSRLPVLEPEALTEAESLIELLEPVGDLAARFVVGWIYWHRFQAMPSEDDQDLLQLFVPGSGRLLPWREQCSSG